MPYRHPDFEAPALGGTHQAFGVVTNAQDFMRLLQLELFARIGR